jgi:hypothetical protein
MHQRITPSLKALSIYLITLWFICIGSAQALTTFTAGTPAKAAEVNDNFLELLDRINDLEVVNSGETLNIDCSADSTALATAISDALSGTTFIITGTCAGPIFVDRAGLTFRANTAGVDGISATGSDALSIRAHTTQLEDLKITTSAGYIGVLVFNGGIATIKNLHVTGAEWAVIVARGGAAKISDTTNIDVMNAVSGGSLRIEGGNGGFKIGAFRNGTIEIRDTAAGSTFTGIQAADGGVVRARGIGTNITVDGKVDVYRTSSAYFEGPLTVNYGGSDEGLVALENSSVRLRGGTVNALTLAAGSSVIHAYNTAFVDPTDDTKGGYIYVDLASSLVMQAGSTVGAIEADSNSSVVMENATLSGIVSPWDAGFRFALEIGSGAQVEVENSTINDFVNVQAGSVFELEDSTLNGDLQIYQNATVALENSTVNATGATGGTCPSGWDEGIRINVGGTMNLRDATSSINGYLEVGDVSMLAAWSVSDFGGAVDATTDTKTNLTDTGQSTTGIVTCSQP